MEAVPDARAAAPCLSRLRLHHARPQPAPAQLRRHIVCSYASRDATKAEAYRRQFGGDASFADYGQAIDDPAVDAVVVAVPPRFHLDLTLSALAAGKHVLVEKPAFLRIADYQTRASTARDRAQPHRPGRRERPLQAAGRDAAPAAGRRRRSARWCSRISRRSRRRLKTEDDWRNDETMAGGDAFFEEGIHWLHVAGSLGPTIVDDPGFRPSVSRERARPARRRA